MSRSWLHGLFCQCRGTRCMEGKEAQFEQHPGLETLMVGWGHLAGTYKEKTGVEGVGSLYSLVVHPRNSLNIHPLLPCLFILPLLLMSFKEFGVGLCLFSAQAQLSQPQLRQLAMTRQLCFLQGILMPADVKRVSSCGTTELNPPESRDSKKPQPNQFSLG